MGGAFAAHSRSPSVFPLEVSQHGLSFLRRLGRVELLSPDSLSDREGWQDQARHRAKLTDLLRSRCKKHSDIRKLCSAARWAWSP